MNTPRPWHERANELMAARGYTCRWLAQELGLAAKKVARLLAGEVEPTPFVRMQVSQILGQSAKEAALLSDQPTTQSAPGDPETAPWGRALQIHLTNRRLTWLWLAEQLGITASFLHAVKFGRKPPPPAITDRIVVVLGMNSAESMEFRLLGHLQAAPVAVRDTFATMAANLQRAVEKGFEPGGVHVEACARASGVLPITSTEGKTEQLAETRRAACQLEEKYRLQIKDAKAETEREIERHQETRRTVQRLRHNLQKAKRKARQLPPSKSPTSAKSPAHTARRQRRPETTPWDHLCGRTVDIDGCRATARWIQAKEDGSFSLWVHMEEAEVCRQVDPNRVRLYTPSGRGPR